MAKIQIGETLDVLTLSKLEAKVGTIVESMLTLAQFQEENLGIWKLCDGSSSSNTLYATMTGKTNFPDMRGAVMRMKGYSSGKNPDGDLALGTYQADQFASHNHAYGNTSGSGNKTGAPVPNALMHGDAWWWNYDAPAGTLHNGGNETRMKNVTVNFFIKADY